MTCKRSQNVAMGKQWLSLLFNHTVFSARDEGNLIDIEFHYAEPSDENLGKLREVYDLEAVAGQGSEIDRIINLMSWVYRLTGHANEPEIPAERNAFTLINMAKNEKKQINCYMKTVILNEVYLSMGFYSRHTHLLPHSNEERESHFITSVYSQTVERWILMDPDFGVYVTDAKGNILGIREIRQHLISGEPLKVVRPGRSSVKNAWMDFVNLIDGTDYPWFLSCFIFKIRCPKNSMFDQDSKPLREHYELIPDGYRDELLLTTTITDKGNKIHYIGDGSSFWLPPKGQSH